jgi:hypothetical protein
MGNSNEIESHQDANRVILHQFPRGLNAPSASPFALKLETWFVISNTVNFNSYS